VVPADRLDVALELFYDGAWHDIVTDDDVLARAPIVIRRGQGGSPALRPARVTALLANDDDRYRVSNPESPLYGRAGRNTPARVSVGGGVRGVVEAASWVSGQSPDFRRHPRRGSAWTDFRGAGVLERVNGWTQPLKSAFRQYNETLTHCIGYFPCEQARGSTDLYSTVPGTTSEGSADADFTGFAFDSQHRPPGSAPLMDVGDQAALGIYFNRDTATAGATAGWQLSWAFRAEPLGTGSLRTIMNWRAVDGHGYRLDLLPDTGEINLISTSLDTTVSYGTYDWTQWTLISIDAQYSAPNTTVFVNWTNADRSAGGFFNGGSFAGVPSSLAWWSILGEADEIPPGSTIGHVQAVDVSSAGGVDLFTADRLEAWTGHLGERAAVRFARLCDLYGIPYIVSPEWAQSAPMGPQPVAPLWEQFREIAETDDALIHDGRETADVNYLARVDRYTQTPAVVLRPQDLAVAPEESTAGDDLANYITVAQRDGGEAVAEDTSGPLGTQDPPDGAGRAERVLDVNVEYETVLPDLANWWLRKGTIDLPRFPELDVNLAALDAATRAAVAAVDIGEVIVLTDFREYDIRLHVLGYTETIRWPRGRRIQFQCALDQQFNIGTYGVDQTFRRYGSGSTTLKAAVNASATAVTFRTADQLDVWSTSTPYDVVIAGQRNRVTSMGAASLVSGEYDQAATLSRGVDGITKPLAAGDPIRVADGGIWGL
jgi:hypothetical protein